MKKGFILKGNNAFVRLALLGMVEAYGDVRVIDIVDPNPSTDGRESGE